MRILGIDPGYERLGLSVIEGERSKETLIYSECFRTSAKIPFEERLLLIGERVEYIIKKYKPEILAIENLFLSNNQKTAMRVSEVRGAIIYLGLKKGLKVFEYTPLQIKNSVLGYGKGDKKQIQFMVPKLIKMPSKVRFDDEYDAVAIALTASASIRR